MKPCSDGIAEDLAQFRAQLRDRQIPYEAMLQLRVWRPLADILVDLVVVALSVAAVMELSLWLVPAALMVIGNRQRALGNVLHDGGHRNFHRSPRINDGIVRLLLAPLLFASLSRYRELHFRHHLELGNARLDPDYLPPPDVRPVGWRENLLRQLVSPRTWLGSVAGHLLDRNIRLSSRLYILLWWSIAGLVLAAATNATVVLATGVLWISARATAFHCITVFREMCDHFGLPTGHVVSFTRDVVSQGFCAWVIHPRNNGYHLTHHLMPAVPYYRLPEAQRLFAYVPMYRQYDRTYSSYVLGTKAVVTSWATEARA